MSDETKGAPVTYEAHDGVAVVRIDDGKANALGHEAIGELNAALDRSAEEGAGAVAILGRPGRFSAGFDLNTMRAGIGEARDLLRVGGELALRLYSSPVPVVLGVTGHALAMGAILLLSADVRIGTRGDFKIGLNEVAIGMPVPGFAVELARARLSPRHLTYAVNLATVYHPEGALAAGYLDELAEADQVEGAAVGRARQLAEGLRPDAFRATRTQLREELASRLRASLQADLEAFTIEA